MARRYRQRFNQNFQLLHCKTCGRPSVGPFCHEHKSAPAYVRDQKPIGKVEVVRRRRRKGVEGEGQGD